MNNVIIGAFKKSTAQEDALRAVKQAKSLTDMLNFDTVYFYESRRVLYNYFMKQVSKFRIAVYKRMAFDPDYNAWIHKYSRQDKVSWINLFGWTYDPIRNNSQATPFVCYGYHAEYIYSCMNHKHTITIKPRGSGYTWVKAFDKLIRLLYDEAYQCAIVSRVVSDIDVVGDRHQTIMGRIRFAMECLPFFDIDTLDENKEGFIQYNGNSIRAYTSNPDALRSGRSHEVDIEEAGVLQNFTAVMAAAVSVSKEIRIGGTVKGVSSGFYDFWRNRDSKYLHIFWKHNQHPLFSTEDWEKMELAKYNNDIRLFRQEVLGDFWAMVGESILVDLDKERHMIPLDRINKSRMRRGVSIDPGAGSSPTAIWFFYYDTYLETFYFVHYEELFKCTHKDVSAAIYKYNEGEFAPDSGTIYLIDAAARNVTPEGNSWWKLLVREGLRKMYLVDNKNISGSILVANQNLRDDKIFFDENSPAVESGVRKLTRYVFSDIYGAKKVKKDLNSDCGDALRYSQVFPYLLQRKKDVPKMSDRVEKQKERLITGLDFTRKKKGKRLYRRVENA